MADLGTFVLRTAQALEHRRRGDLLMQISKTLDERLPRLGMASVKLIDEARSDRIRARPALEAFKVALVAGFNLGQRGQHLLYLWGQNATIRLGLSSWFVDRGT
jgi:hypothetical protein